MRSLTYVVLAGVSACVCLLGQPPTPAFNAVSIGPHEPGAAVQLPGCSSDGFLSAGIPFGVVHQWAYPLPGIKGVEFQQSVPPSVGMEVYDIRVKADHPVAEPECRVMVQAVLAARFKLAVHFESRDADIGELVVASGGPKIQKALASDQGADVNVLLDGRPARGLLFGPRLSPAAKGLSMQDLAQILTVAADPGVLTQIVDKTDLEGRYKVDFRFSDHMGLWDPIVDAALDEQLGLRLEKHRGSVRVPVLDHIEAPASN